MANFASQKLSEDVLYLELAIKELKRDLQKSDVTKEQIELEVKLIRSLFDELFPTPEEKDLLKPNSNLN